MMEPVKDRLVFTYESDAAASYLVVTVDGDEKVWSYQMEMVANNRIKRVLPFDARMKDGRMSFYYRVTSKIPLVHFLKKIRIKKHEFIQLLLDITSVLLDSRYYLLFDQCFILDERFIYINPATREISLAYVPVPADDDTGQKLRKLVIGLIVHTADIEEDSGDNFVHKLLALVKSDMFSVLNLNSFLKELAGDSPLPAVDTDGPSGDCASGTPAVRPVKEEYNKVKAECSPGIDVKPRPVIIALLFQILFAVMLVLANKYVKSSGRDTVATYAAIALIVIAVDILLFKKLFISMHHRKDEDPGGQEESLDVMESKSSESSTDHSDSRINETVFLGCPDETFPYLLGGKDSMPKIIPIVKPDFVVGRLQSQVDHVIHNKAVGKVHARIISREGSYYVMDFNSRNGTFINGVRIDCSTEVEIRNNDRLAFANSEYVFVAPLERKVDG